MLPFVPCVSDSPTSKKPRKEWPRRVVSGNVVVKVYRVKHATARTGWAYVVARSVAGRRVLQKFADLDEAMTEARLKAEQLNAGRVEGASMTTGDRDELTAARQIVAGASPLLPALREWRKAHELTQGQLLQAAEAWRARHRSKITAKPVADVITAFLAAKKKAEFNTAANHGSILRAVSEALGKHPIHAVFESQITAYLDSIDNPVTRNTHRKRIVTLWRWAQSKGLLPRDVKTEADLTARAREEAPHVGIISSERFRTLLELVRANAPADLPALILAGFCGLRRGEIHGQAWEDVALDKQILRVTKAKRGTPARRLVPLSAAAVEWLLLADERKGAVSDGLAIDRIRKIARDAKPQIELPENAFRHSFISHRVAATGNVAETSLEAGNSAQIIHRHYRELVTKAEGAAWFDVRPAELGKVVTYAP
jgi:integrase